MTVVLAIAAVGGALLALFGDRDSFTMLTAVGALAGLVPWALVAGGVTLAPAVFIVLSVVPGAIVVVGDANPGGMFALMFLTVWIGRTTGLSRWLVLALASNVALIAWVSVLERTLHETGFFYFLGGSGISALAGVMLHRQERLSNELREMQQLQIEHAAASERARIAREVHDVVAHSLTVVMLHLGGARRAMRSDPVGAADALERAETVGRESLDSIRHVVGLLRDPAPPEGFASEPVGDLDALIDGFRSAGVEIDSSVDPSDVDLGSELDAPTRLTVYRIVQEALANAVRHAPGASCRVEVIVAGCPPHLVHLDITNGPPGHTNDAVPATSSVDRVGLGVRGIVERARAAGGSADVGPTPEGGWCVSVRLPLRRAGSRPGVTASAQAGRHA